MLEDVSGTATLIANIPQHQNQMYLIGQRNWRNAIRDKRNLSQLKTMNYKQFIIWECEAKNPQFLDRKIKTIVQ